MGSYRACFTNVIHVVVQALNRNLTSGKRWENLCALGFYCSDEVGIRRLIGKLGKHLKDTTMKKIARIAILSLAVAVPASNALAVDEHFVDDSAAIGGYDTVAYHTVGMPVEGSAEHTATYQGVTWHFSSAENKELFEAEPAKYAPAYGGWCAAGASKGKKVPTDADLWTIVDGQLYLNSSPKAHNDLFLAKTEEVIRKGESNWKQIFATPSEDL